MLDETWEMNMHINPLDEETQDTINRHKAIIDNKTDDFIAYIQHTENARLQQIKENVFQHKMTDFAVEPEIRDSKRTDSQKSNRSNKKNKKIK